ncbi:MAG: fumarylacetoacetate hydrolase family protein [Thermoleophilia bacterium]|jgi:2-keto-4-pentenoate hydratase/2-oxohepta-3-ene-1,7-dioic acid hydratase in catechol pathway
MKIARVEYQGDVYPALVTCSGYQLDLSLGADDTSYNSQAAGMVVSADDVTLLPPVLPGKILGVGWNFREHVAEMTDRRASGEEVVHVAAPGELPPFLVFMKPPSSLIGHGDAIVYPKEATKVEYEGELAVVISRTIRRVTPEEARTAVLGWTCANDVTERNLQAGDGQWWRAKGYDTFAVAGPFLETEPPSSDAWIRTRVNGRLCQEGQILAMFRDPYVIISLLSQAMTLQRGDLIMLGTPPGVGPLQPGDVVEVEIDGVGYLKNHVVAED